MDERKDYMIRGQDKTGQVRFFAVTTKHLVDEKGMSQNYSPIATAATGRLMSATLMMGAMLKNEDERVVVQIKGEGPLGGVVASANRKGEVKGYAEHPDVILPANEFGHLAVGDSITPGRLSVIHYSKLGEPHVATLDLVSGEIGDDLSYYFGQSEQTPSVVGVGVSFQKDVHVKAAGGYIVQLLPNANDDTISKLEQNIMSMKSPSEVLFTSNDDPEALIKGALKGFDYEITEEKEVCFHCECSKEKSLQIISTLGIKDLKEIVDDGKGASLSCDYCGKSYDFSHEDVLEIFNEKLAKNN